MDQFITSLIAPIPAIIVALWGVALVISSLGFFRTVYFISIGYAFSITVMTAIIAVTQRDRLTVVTLLQLVGLAAWSVRLGVFLVRRETTEAYRRQMAPTYQRTNAIPFKAKFFIWLSVSLLYVAMFSPALFSTHAAGTSGPVGDVTAWIGVVILFGGLILESVADSQKSAYKRTNSSRFCAVGLYQIVRYPNYLGEILFWIGNFVIGAAFFTGILQWVIAAIGLVCIILIMMGSTKRLESSQRMRYGHLNDYQQYTATVPVLFPFIPVYSLENIRVYIE